MALMRSGDGGVRTCLSCAPFPCQTKSWSSSTAAEMRRILPRGTFTCRTVRDVSKAILSVRRDEPLPPPAAPIGLIVERGRFEGVPGTPPGCELLEVSSVFCEVDI